MDQIIRIGVDTSKSVFVLHGVNAADEPVLCRKLRRRQVLNFFSSMAPVRIGLEACGAAHYWARELNALGHTAVLLPPQYVKPYVQRGKNDTADASAICEAMSRPRCCGKAAIIRAFSSAPLFDFRKASCAVSMYCSIVACGSGPPCLGPLQRRSPAVEPHPCGGGRAPSPLPHLRKRARCGSEGVDK
jgi:hypothetical protein